MSLPTPEEFNFMLSSVARDDAYAAAYALTETQAKQIDVLMEAGKLMAKRIGQLEEWQEVSLKMSEETHEVMDVVVSQRDAALASLAEAVAIAQRWARNHGDGYMCDANCRALRALAAATPGRGEKLLAVVEAARVLLSDLTGVALKEPYASSRHTLRVALAALDADGAQRRPPRQS
jgi:hypothetical protein